MEGEWGSTDKSSSVANDHLYLRFAHWIYHMMRSEAATLESHEDEHTHNNEILV